MRSRDGVNEVRRALSDPRRVCHALGLAKNAQLQPQGVLIVCPWHEDRGPSCSVTRGTDRTIRVKCHGCGESGDVLHLVAIANGLDVKRDFREVLKRAAELAGCPDLALESVIEREIAAPAIDDDVFDAIACFLLSRCMLHPSGAGSAYLRARGVLEQAIEDGWGELPSYERQAPIVAAMRERFADSHLLGAGLLWTGPGGIDPRALRNGAHRLLMPWRAANGRILALQRRVLGVPKEGRPKYLFTTGRSPRAPYGVASLRSGRDLAIVEGAFDQLAVRVLLRSSSIERDVIAIAGVQAWRSEFGKRGTGRRVLIALDGDKAGAAAVARLAADLFASGAAAVFRWEPPSNVKDWAELVERRARCA
jgi:DNA primase